MKDKVVLEFKNYCRESSVRIFQESTEREEVTSNEVTNIWNELTYCCFVAARGQTINTNLMVFFNEKIVGDLVKSCFPWEKDHSLNVGIGLFSEYSNMFMAAIKKSLEQVDYLNLGVPVVNKIEGESVTLLGSAQKHFPKEKKVLLRDSWSLAMKEGHVYNHLRTEVNDIDKFMKGNFDSGDDDLQGGDVMIF
ncbi:hypothetical protein OAK75_04750 [Bacteriovoracales bacterium]|nr:hypothetical protein [Bacteriovoracales bacterium]